MHDQPVRSEDSGSATSKEVVDQLVGNRVLAEEIG
jgi:hypothetical protein